MTKKSNAFWPSVNTPEEARQACRNGAWVALVVAFVTGGLALLSLAGVSFVANVGVDGWSLVDAALFVALAWGLFRCSRVAAVGALAFYLVERALALAGGQFGGIPMVVVFTLVFVGAARGAFAHHRLQRASIVPSAA